MIDQKTAESAVLACLLAYPSQSANYIAENFNPAMFSREGQFIYAAAQDVICRNGTCNAQTVIAALGDRLPTVGGAARIFDLEINSVPPIALPEYAKTLREALALKQLRSTLSTLLNEADGGNAEVGDILAEGMAAMDTIANARTEHAAPSVQSLLGDAIKNIQSRVDGTTNGISTGIGSIDRVTGGIRPASQWVIAGPAKGGKSSLAITMLASLAIMHKKRCAFYGLEMPSVENIERLLCHEGPVNASSCRDGALNDYQMTAIATASARIAAAPIHFRDDLFELTEITANARQLKTSLPDLFAIFVDYAQLVGAAKPGENREREVATVSRQFRKFAMQSGVAVILLSQTNDDGKLRESRTLGMDATKILTLEFGESPQTRKIKLVQRDGISGVEIVVGYHGEHFKFTEIKQQSDHEI